ncbi:MAG TPA: peptidase M23 [Bacteroidia bacterium]
MTIKISIALLATVVSIASCTSSHDKTEKAANDVIQADNNLKTAQEELDRSNAVYKQELEAYMAEKKTAIEDNNRTIAELKATIATQKKEAKAEYAEQIAELDRKNNELMLKLEAHKDDSKDNWDKFKTEFNHDMDELGQAFKDLTVRNTNKK